MSAAKTKQISHQTAVHEAGHAVVAILEGRQFREISVGTATGTTATVRDLMCTPGDDEIIRIVLAGIMAARLIRRSWGESFFDTARDDIGIVADFLRGSAEKKISFYLSYNIPATANQLTGNWTAVLEIANRFRCNRVVSHAEALAIFKDSRFRTSNPDGRLGIKQWKPLEERIRWRIEYPRGYEDVVARFLKLNKEAGG